MKKENKVTNKDLDKFVAEEIKEKSNQKEIYLLQDQNIAISISDSPEIEYLGFSLAHQKNLITEDYSQLLSINIGPVKK